MADCQFKTWIKNNLLGPVRRLCISYLGLLKTHNPAPRAELIFGIYLTHFGTLSGDHWFVTPEITSGYCLRLSGFLMERALIRCDNQNHRQCGRMLERKHITVVNTFPSDATRVPMQLIRFDFNVGNVLHYCWFITCRNCFSNSLYKCIKEVIQQGFNFH